MPNQRFFLVSVIRCNQGGRDACVKSVSQLEAMVRHTDDSCVRVLSVGSAPCCRGVRCSMNMIIHIQQLASKLPIAIRFALEHARRAGAW
jgi:hypothetical protein